MGPRMHGTEVIPVRGRGRIRVSAGPSRALAIAAPLTLMGLGARLGAGQRGTRPNAGAAGAGRRSRARRAGSRSGQRGRRFGPGVASSVRCRAGWSRRHGNSPGGDCATPESAVIGTGVPGPTVATLPRDLSPWGMFMAADNVVKAVMIGLVVASLVTWTVWLAKSMELLIEKRRARAPWAWCWARAI